MSSPDFNWSEFENYAIKPPLCKGRWHDVGHDGGIDLDYNPPVIAVQ